MKKIKESKITERDQQRLELRYAFAAGLLAGKHKHHDGMQYMLYAQNYCACSLTHKQMMDAYNLGFENFDKPYLYNDLVHSILRLNNLL